MYSKYKVQESVSSTEYRAQESVPILSDERSAGRNLSVGCILVTICTGEGNVLTSRNWFSLFSLFHVRNVSTERVTGTVASHTSHTHTDQLLDNIIATYLAPVSGHNMAA